MGLRNTPRLVGFTALILACLEGSASALKTASHRQPTPSAAVDQLECDIGGGFLSVSVSARCCFSAQVVMQRGLVAFGLGRKCKKSWQCSVDGVLPKPSFEDHALREMCADRECYGSIVAAMRGSYVASKGADSVEAICEKPTTVSAATDQTLMYFRHGNSTNSSKNTTNSSKKKASAKVDDSDDDSTANCFPGHAMATSEIGPVPLGALRPGDRVLARTAGGGVDFEPVLGFLHTQPVGAAREHLAVGHERGVLRVSQGHLVFVQRGGGIADKTAAEIQVGDELLTSTGAGPSVEVSRVLWIEREVASSGMFAPYTMSGTIVVDGVMASNYAAPSKRARLPHWLAHAAVAPMRMYQRLGLARLFAVTGPQKLETVHPYLALLLGLKLDRLLPLLKLS